MMDAVQQANENNQEGLGKNNNGSNFVCRQSSTRWTPTTEQIRILKDLYYNNGVRSPTAEQIQRISAKLRQYGKIEGKNVFYWFQNHKARERQKKRFTTTNDHIHIPMPMHTNNNNVIISNNCNNNRPNAAGINHHVSPIYNNFSNKMNPGNFASPSSTSTARGLLSVGNYGYGSVSMAMEKSFRECSITPNVNACGSMGQKFAWLGVDHPYPNFVEKRKYNINDHQTLEINGQDEEDPDQIETLPLFPMHGDDADDIKHDYNINGWQSSDDPRASLELTLNSSYAATSASTSFNIFK